MTPAVNRQHLVEIVKTTISRPPIFDGQLLYQQPRLSGLDLYDYSIDVRLETISLRSANLSINSPCHDAIEAISPAFVYEIRFMCTP